MLRQNYIIGLALITITLYGCCGNIVLPPRPSAPPDTLAEALPPPPDSKEEKSFEMIIEPPIWNTADDVVDDCKQRIDKAGALRAEVVTAEGPRTTENTLEPVNDILIEVYTVLSIAELISSVHPDKPVRDAAEKCQQDAMKFVTQFELDREIYDALTQVDNANLESVTARFLSHLLRDYRLAGVDKDEATREKLAAIREEMVKVGQDFRRAIREDKRAIEISKSDTAGLPKELLASHLTGKGMYRFTTDTPDFMPVVNYVNKEEVRKKMYLTYLKRGHPANDENLIRLLTLRYQYATLLGYEDWVSYSSVDKMANDKKIVADFIDKVADIARPRMQRDIKALLKRKRQDIKKANHIRVWDRFYYANKIKAEKYQMDAKTLRAYFEYDNVLRGLLTLSQELFGITFQKVDDAEVWHPDVTAYNVLEREQVIGRFYLDMHPRDGKYGHAAEFGMVTGIAGRYAPAASLVCNFPKPTEETPALLEHDQVTTLFHEFGHLLHQILGGRHQWVTLSGIACERDFIEAPSQLYEHWAWEYEVLKRFAVHHETGETIPRELVEKMKKADEFSRGAHVMRQMYYAGLSYHYHAQNPEGMDLLSVVKSMQEKYSPYPYEKGTYVYASFGHLEGYSSSYYTYMWSLSLSEDIFTRFQDEGLLNKETAMAYRKAVLDPGGTVDAIEMVKTFLGRDTSFDALKHYLTEGE
jgi:thimet oligopeptidase